MAKKVLLVGLDGADWKIIRPLIAAGSLPNFRRLIEGGVSGDIATQAPTLSPLLWHSIATGKRALHHGVHGFTELDAATGRPRPVSRRSRQCAMLWEILEAHGRKTNVINWFASHPAESLSGVCVSDLFTGNIPPQGQPWPCLAGSVAPSALHETLADLRLHPAEIPAEVFGLFVPELHRVDLEKEKLPGELAKEIAIATNIQTVLVHALTRAEWDFTAVYYRFIDLLGHHFMQFHPPQMAGVKEDEFAIYHDVINSGYRLFDLFLGAMRQAAGPETTLILVSDHGFYSDERRPRPETLLTHPEAWHREQGVLILNGPGIKQGETIAGARLLDITPTILNIFELPVGGDMVGRVLAEAHAEFPAIDAVASHESAVGQWRKDVPPVAALTDEESVLLLKQMEELGYIRPLSKDAQEARAQVWESNQWNLARDCIDAGLNREAMRLLDGLVQARPANSEYRLRLAFQLWRCGLTEESEKLTRRLMDFATDQPMLDYLRGHLAVQRKDYTAALTHFRKAAKAPVPLARLNLYLGQVLIALGRGAEAEELLFKELALDPDSAAVHEALARIYLTQRRWEEAAGRAHRATELNHASPTAHFYMGLALERLNYREYAINAFEAAVTYAPQHSGAHRALARLYAKSAAGGTKTEYHRHCIAQRANSHGDRDQAIAGLKADRAAWLERGPEAGFGLAGSETKPPASPSETPGRPLAAGRPAKPVEVVVVSGQPRSGTSLMMQMLQAGGLEIVTDARREADADNPRGYWEWEAIKSLPGDPSLIDQCDGRGVKIVASLLIYLPPRARYKVIYMQRPSQEIARSQNAMIRRRNPEARIVDEERMAGILEKSSQAALDHLQDRSHIDLLIVPYPDLVADPARWVREIQRFLGRERLPKGSECARAIDPGLYRQRSQANDW